MDDLSEQIELHRRRAEDAEELLQQREEELRLSEKRTDRLRSPITKLLTQQGTKDDDAQISIPKPTEQGLTTSQPESTQEQKLEKSLTATITTTTTTTTEQSQDKKPSDNDTVRNYIIFLFETISYIYENFLTD